MPALGYWYILIFFKNPVLALICHTLIYHNACKAEKAGEKDDSFHISVS